MLALPTPVNVGQLQAAIGLLNYYRDYVPGFSTIVPFHVDDAGAAAFEKLKRVEDWSQLGMGGVLVQLGDDGMEYLVTCISRSWAWAGVVGPAEGHAAGPAAGDDGMEYLVTCISRSCNRAVAGQRAL
jgi:hypothetical protein